MLVDGINLVEGSEIANLTVATGASLPGSPNDGEMFYLTTGSIGLYVYDSSTPGWVQVTTATDVNSGGGSGLPVLPAHWQYGGKAYHSSGIAPLVNPITSAQFYAYYMLAIPFLLTIEIAPVSLFLSYPSNTGGNAVMGIYDVNTSGGLSVAGGPGTKLAGTSQFAFSSSSHTETIDLNGGSPISTPLSPGWYYIVYQQSVTTYINGYNGTIGGGPLGHPMGTSSNPMSYVMNTSYGSLQNPLPTTFTGAWNSVGSSVAPLIWMVV